MWVFVLHCSALKAFVNYSLVVLFRHVGMCPPFFNLLLFAVFCNDFMFCFVTVKELSRRYSFLTVRVKQPSFASIINAYIYLLIYFFRLFH